ncbi:MAG: DUF1559 domain-containing protein [Pirellulales bacterium]|nr:DUF1559 domain-containing protein [Pirellulales bacterium]
MRAHRTRVSLGAVLLVYCLPAMLRADDVASYESIQRLLDEQAIAVARLDLKSASPLSILQVVEAQPDLAATVQDAEQAAKLAERIRDAAGPIAYLIYSVPLSTELSALWAVPLSDSTNPAAALKAFPANSRLTDKWDRKVVDGLLIAGPKRQVAAAAARLESETPAAELGRVSLEEAFAAVADAPSAFAIVPSADQRRVLREVTPDLPAPFGEAKLREFLQRVEWGAVGIDPEKSLHIVLQTASTEAAAETKRLAEDLQQSMANVDVASPEGLAGLLLPLAATLKPESRGDQVHFQVDGAQLASALAPAVKSVATKADRAAAMNQFKQVAIAMHNYHSAVKDANGKSRFPDVASTNTEGKPLLSWRVHLLPYLDQGQLYGEFHLDEPWDSEHNKKLLERMPDIFRLPGVQAGVGKTCMVLPVGKQTAFPDGKGLAIRDFTDGTSNTILSLEVDNEHAVPWTAPDDLKVDAADPTKGLGQHYGEGTLVMIADGSVRFLPQATTAEQWKALLSPAGGEVIERN